MKQVLLFLGIGLFSFTLGSITGASNSPIAGGIISGLLGISVAILSLYERNDTTKIKANLIGPALIACSLGLLMGTFLGVEYRFYDRNPTVAQGNFVWKDSSSAPSTVYEALDWVLTQRLLSNSGFSETQIMDLYAIRRRQISDTISFGFMSRAQYNVERPYYKMFMEGYKPEPHYVARQEGQALVSLFPK